MTTPTTNTAWAEVSARGRELAALVHALQAFTPEEIRIVEDGSA